MEMLIGMDWYPVTSIKEASLKWLVHEQNEIAAGRGGSRRMPTVLVYDEAGNRLARISYNGRAWDNNDNEILL